MQLALRDQSLRVRVLPEQDVGVRPLRGLHQVLPLQGGQDRRRHRRMSRWDAVRPGVRHMQLGEHGRLQHGPADAGSHPQGAGARRGPGEPAGGVGDDTLVRDGRHPSTDLWQGRVPRRRRQQAGGVHARRRRHHAPTNVRDCRRFSSLRGRLRCFLSGQRPDLPGQHRQTSIRPLRRRLRPGKAAVPELQRSVHSGGREPAV
mmetsp:Transcript_55155/g.117207  ORF Transcript_55155/g.117207 Transcript_55155/m.117207 type:complete len:203 (-) Transcript_55155:1959-2567(-)